MEFPILQLCKSEAIDIKQLDFPVLDNNRSEGSHMPHTTKYMQELPKYVVCV